MSQGEGHVESRLQPMPVTMILPVSLACFASSLTIRIFDPLVPLIARDFAVAPDVAAQVASSFTLPYALAQLPMGVLGDRWDKLSLIRVAVAGLAVLTAALLFCESLTSFALLRGAAGLISAAIVPMALAAIGDATPLALRSRTLAYAVFGILTGMLLGVACGGVLAQTLGWRVTMLFAAAVCCLAWVVLPASKSRRVEHTTLGDLRAQWQEIFSHPLSTVAYLGVFIDGACIFGLTPFLGDRLERMAIGSTVEAGFLIACLAGGGILFTILMMLLGDRLIMRQMVVVGGLLCATALAAVSQPFSLAGLCLIATTLGFGFYMLHNVLQTMATELSASSRGLAVSIHACCFFLGQAIGPLLYAVGFALIGREAPIIVAGSALAALVIWLSFKLKSH